MSERELSTDPWWWMDVPREPEQPVELPKSVDVLVVGSGYTGLHAALVAARAGKSVLVLDAQSLGFGCSSRNGGQVSRSVKPTVEQLSKRHSKDLALRIHREGQASLNWLDGFIKDEQLDCDFSRCGRFHAAHNSSALEKLKRSIAAEHAEFKTGAVLVEKADQHRYIATDDYAGGAFFPEHASLHPAKYHQALLSLVHQAGGVSIGYCPVLKIDGGAKIGGAQHVLTQLGTVTAGQVVIATNGYTGSGLVAKSNTWLQKRVIPIGSYMIATQEIEPEILSQLLPSQCIISDSRKVVYYYRKSGDGKRVIFGGRVSSAEIDPLDSGPLLKAELDRLLPSLTAFKISHSWSGTVAYTFDELPHIGQQQGVHYAMGYCGSGVGMGSYLGMQLGHQVLRSCEGKTIQQKGAEHSSAFSETKFQTRPLYSGNPWFLAPSVAYYRWRDKLNM